MSERKNASDYFPLVATPKSSTKASVRNKSRWTTDFISDEEVSQIVDSVFSKVGLPDFGNVTPEVSRASTAASRNHRSTASSSSYLTDASSLGILSVGNMSDFSIAEEMPMDSIKGRSESPSSDLDNFEEMYKIPYPDIETATQNFRQMLDQVIDAGPDFTKLSFDSKLKNLFGDESEEVKQILDSSSIVGLDSSSIHGDTENKNLRAVDMELLGNKTKRSEEEKNSLLETPKKTSEASQHKLSGSVMDTPFTRFMKAAPPSISDESVDESIVNPFGERSSFEVEKLYEGKFHTHNNTDVSFEPTNLSNKSDVVFCDEHISARSSSLSQAKDSVDSSCSTSGTSVLQKTCIQKESPISEDKGVSSCQSDVFAISDATDMALQQNFFGGEMFFADDIGENEFLSKETGLKMIQDDEENFESGSFYKSGMNDSSAGKQSFWSLSNQPALIERPSWWSDANSSVSQIHLSQLIGARTETLGSLSDDLERPRPFFGTVVVSPEKKVTRKAASNTTSYEDDSLISKHKPRVESNITDNSNADNSVVSLSKLSEILADISLQDVPSAISCKFQEKKPQKTVKKCKRKSDAKQAGRKHDLQDQDHFYSASVQQKRKASSIKRHSQLAARYNVADCSSDEKSMLLSSTNASPKRMIVNCGDAQEHLQRESASQSALHRSSSFDALGLTNYASVKHHFESDSATGVPQTKIKHSSDTESSTSDTKSHSSFSTITCGSARCCQHPHASSCCLVNGTSSVSCPFSATPNFHNNFPIRSSCASTIRNFHEHHVPVCSCITSGMLNVPFPSQTVQHVCMNDFSSSSSNINLAASFPPPHMYARPMQNYAVPMTMTGSGVPVCIQGPKELKFPSTCVGDKQVATLNLHNPTVAPLFYHFHLVSATQNGSEVPISLTGVSCEPVVQALALSPVDVELSYAAQVAGEMMVQLHISASHSRDATCSLVGLPFVVKLVLHAENPRISLFSNKGKDKLEFSAVMENSSVSGILTLENLCGAPVPLKLEIEEQVDKNHNFSFAIQDGNIHSNTLEAQKFSYVSSKVVLCKVGNPSAPFANKLSVPITFTAGECQNGGKTERVSAVVAAFLGNSTKQVPLAAIQMSATVGTVCLCLKPPLKDQFLMRSAINCKISHNFTLLNKGSIPISADLGIQCECDSFSVVPPTVHMAPDTQIRITVYFEPSSQEPAMGVLQAAPPNQDKIFDLAKFRGEVLQNFQLSSSYQNRSSSRTALRDSIPGSLSNQITVESNKKCLSWGGVGIGQVIMKTVSIRNPSSTDVFRAKAVISEKCPAYMLVNDVNNEKVSSMDLVLKPKMQKQISVVFSPTEKKTYIGHLSLKPALLEKQAYFSIPLNGYGGMSNVKILNLLLEQGDDMCFNLRLVSTHDYEVIFANLTLCNVGCRAAFVKILCVKADSMDNFDEEQKISIHPSEFILLEQERKNIQVTYSSDADYSFHPNKKIGKILIYFGDEMMRQKMRRCHKADFSILANNPLRNVNFDNFYAGEENVVRDDSYPDSKRDFSLFYNSLQKITVNAVVVAESSNLSQVTSFSALSLVQDSMYKQGPAVEVAVSDRLCGSSPPVRDLSVSSFRKESTAESDFSSCESPDDFSVGNSSFHSLNSSATEQNSFHSEVASTCTDQFSVAPHKLTLDSENRDLRLVITSHSKTEMRFKLTWSVNVICVSPVQGVIPPKSEMGLRVRVLPYFDGKQRDEVIEGFISIFCGGSEKYVPVKVCLNSLKSKNYNNPIKNFLSVDNVATYSDSLLSRSEKDVKIASTSYTSPRSHSPKNTRVKNAFTGDTRMEKPLDITDITLTCNGNSSEPLETYVTSASDSEAPLSSETLDKNSNVSKLHRSRNGSSNVQKSLIVEPEAVDFPVAKPNEKKTALVTLKNPGSKSYQVTVEKPDPPFVIKRTSFTAKPNYFVSFQVHFCPKSPASYHGILSVAADNGFQTKIKMNGSCQL